MAKSDKERQADHRKRQQKRGCKQLALYFPEALLADIDAEAKQRGFSRSDIVVERLKRKLPKPIPAPAPLPKDISKEADRIVHLIGKGLRVSTDEAATNALSDAMDAIYGLAGMVARQGPNERKHRRGRGRL